MSSDKIDPGDELRIINDMQARTRRHTAESSDFFIAWGIIILLALGVMWGLVHMKEYQYIWLNWTIFTALGVGYSFWKVKRLQRTAGVKTYADTAVAGTWIALGVAFVLLNFLGWSAGFYSDSLLPTFFNVTLAGCGVFITGILLKANILIWSGVAWWIGTVIVAFWGGVINPIGLYMLLILVAYLLPSIYLKHSWK